MAPNHPALLPGHFATGSRTLLSLSALHIEEACHLLHLNCTRSTKHQPVCVGPPGFLEACPHEV